MCSEEECQSRGKNRRARNPDSWEGKVITQSESRLIEKAFLEAQDANSGGPAGDEVESIPDLVTEETYDEQKQIDCGGQPCALPHI